MRFRPDTTGTLPTYLSLMFRTWMGPSVASEKSSMKPSSLRMRAIASLVREVGTTTSVWRARLAFRMRVSISAMGSVTFMGLPARLRDTRQLAHQGALPEADAAHREPAHVRPRSAADEAAVVGLHGVLGRPAGLGDHRLLGHRPSSSAVSWRTACRGAQAGAWTPRRLSPS